MCRCHRSRPTRDLRKAKPQTARRQRIESYYNYLCEFGVSRGRRGAPAASIDAGLTWARVWTGLGSARSAALLPLLLPPLRPRPLWPLAEPPSSRQSASRSFGARPCDRARPACAAGDGAWHGRVVERGMCDCRARGARLSGETLDVGHLGSVWSPGCGLRAHMTA